MPARKRASSKKKRVTVRAPRSTVKRYAPKASGGGAYTLENPGPFGKAGQALGGIVGSHLGGRALGSALSTGGRYLGHKIGKFFGSGAYGYNSSTMSPADQLPKFSNDHGDDSICITHREYLGDLITSNTIGGFKLTTFPINPASTQSFPWLCNIAQPNFQQYRFEGLIFSFQSFSADALNSTNTALGSVFAAVNYDYTDENFTNRNQIENSDWSMSCKPSESMLIPVECAPRQTGMGGLLYVVNDNNIPVNADPKMYFLGKLSVGTTGFQASNINIGSLYVTYKIRLYKKIMTPPLSNALIATFVREGSTAGANVCGTALYGGLIVNNNCDSIGITFPTSNKIRMNKNRLIQGQRYLFVHQWSGVNTVGIKPPDFSLNTSSGCIGSPNTMNNYQTSYNNAPDVASTGATLIAVQTVEITDDSIDSDIEYSPTGFVPPGACLYNIEIYQICGIALNRIGFYDGN